MKQIVCLIFALALLTSTGALASKADAEKGISSVSKCIAGNNPESCKSVLTPSSMELFNRFNSYGLFGCLPSNLSYYADHMQGGHMVVKSILTTPEDQKYLVRLAFLRDGKEWKLDVPKSLEVGLGTEWQSKLNVGEQLYLLLRQQYGEKLTCNMLQGTVKR